MTRAKRIEEAARALDEALTRQDPKRWLHNVADAHVVLRSALALPEEESEVGFVTPKSLDEYGVDHGEGVPRPLAVWPDDTGGASVRVRITVEGEESEP